MSRLLFNVLEAAPVPCPSCGQRSGQEIRLLFGLKNGSRYRLGDRIAWPSGPPAEPAGRPAEGNLDSPGFTACVRCGHEFSVTVHVRSDILVAVEPNLDPRPDLED
jgi:hypothetical protein